MKIKQQPQNVLDLLSFKTPTLWAVMSEEGFAYCASSMRNGVELVIKTVCSITKCFLLSILF